MSETVARHGAELVYRINRRIMSAVRAFTIFRLMENFVRLHVKEVKLLPSLKMPA